ncbi:MAG: HlyD family secretion protein [Candidatus Eremiobacteraeota bacterium]|nr:HlyD family secretion protein [Candidatus Eremiobacteraeota bacterium]
MDTRESQTTAKNGNGAGHGTQAGPPTEEAPAKTGRKRRIGIIVGAIVLIAALIFGVKYFLYARVHQTTDDARIDANTVQVTSKISERVEQIMVDTGQQVHKGQLLMQLNDADERSKYVQALADLNVTRDQMRAQTQEGLGGVAQAQAGISSAQEQAQAAQAQIPVAQAGVSAAQAQVSAARAALPGAQQNLTKAQADLHRTQSLVSTGDVPRQQLDAMRAQDASAQSQYNAAQDNVSVAQANLDSAVQKVGAQAATAGSVASQIGVAQGSLQTAQGKYDEAVSPARITAQKALLSLAQQQLAYTRITAPVDGYIGEKSVQLGQTVGAGMTLITLIPSSNIFITAEYKETQVGDMHIGQPVDITVDAYKGITFHGKVQAINPASQGTYALVPAQNSTGNFVKVTQRIPVKISIDDADPNKYPMRPGMSVETSVKVK